MTKPLGNIETAKEKLFEAINDYPIAGLESPRQLVVELNKNITSPITQEKLRNYSSKLDLTSNAWEAESISLLLEVFIGVENKSLEEIIHLIT